MVTFNNHSYDVITISCNLIGHFLSLTGSDLGLQNDTGPTPAMKGLCSGEKSSEDYAFIHTESHMEFMDLLLAKRKQLESSISAKQKEKRALEEQRALEEAKRKVEETKAGTMKMKV